MNNTNTSPHQRALGGLWLALAVHIILFAGFTAFSIRHHQRESEIAAYEADVNIKATQARESILGETDITKLRHWALLSLDGFVQANQTVSSIRNSLQKAMLGGCVVNLLLIWQSARGIRELHRHRHA